MITKTPPKTIQSYENTLDLYIANRIPGIMESLETIQIMLIIGISILLILGIVILWNQRKIKKMLRELQEQSKDKPQE